MQVDLAISCWNVYFICSKEDKITWLIKGQNILKPLRGCGKNHEQLEQLWGMISEALDEEDK